LPRYSIAAVFLLAVLVGALLGVVPLVLAGAYVLCSIVAYVLYASDKAAAGAGRQRTPEKTLHLVALLGGWPGALVAQKKFRHKTAKASFQVVFWITFVANLAVVAWLLADAGARALMRMSLGG
jgi:uncharacterized membrane protein YsdA (DUF1294 family)